MIKNQLNQEDEWAEVDQYRQIIQERDMLMLKKKKDAEKQEVRTILDKQVKEKKQKKGE